VPDASAIMLASVLPSVRDEEPGPAQQLKSNSSMYCAACVLRACQQTAAVPIVDAAHAVAGCASARCWTMQLRAIRWVNIGWATLWTCGIGRHWGLQDCLQCGVLTLPRQARRDTCQAYATARQDIYCWKTQHLPLVAMVVSRVLVPVAC
jgi:hypothetical protein